MQTSYKPLLQKIDQRIERIERIVSELERELEEETQIKNAVPLDRMFNEKSVLGPRTKYEQRARWKQALKEDLGFEKIFLDLHNMEGGNVLADVIRKEHYPEHYMEGELERTLERYSKSLDNVFHSMHRIAYVEGLLNAENIEYILPGEDGDSL